jgi:endogenous inhibitor of DNA gyrase (YacG/DUF329 family)
MKFPSFWDFVTGGGWDLLFHDDEKKSRKENNDMFGQNNHKDEKKEYAVSAARGTKSIKMQLQCPACNKSFEDEVELIEAEKMGDGQTIQIKAKCPHCGMVLNGSIEKKFYQCSYCTRKFETEEEVEMHKKECALRDA